MQDNATVSVLLFSHWKQDNATATNVKFLNSSYFKDDSYIIVTMYVDWHWYFCVNCLSCVLFQVTYSFVTVSSSLAAYVVCLYRHWCTRTRTFCRRSVMWRTWVLLNIIIYIDIYLSACTGHLVFHTKSYFQYYLSMYRYFSSLFRAHHRSFVESLVLCSSKCVIVNKSQPPPSMWASQVKTSTMVAIVLPVIYLICIQHCRDFLADCHCLFCDAICKNTFDSCWEFGEFDTCFGFAAGVTDDKSYLTYRQSYTRLTT